MENTKSERNIVLRDRKTSVFARKKFTVKKNVRSVRDTDTVARRAKRKKLTRKTQKSP